MMRVFSYKFRLAAVGCVLLAPNPMTLLANPLKDSNIASFKAGELPGLHAAKAELGEDILAEVYFQGEDEAWGKPLGFFQHGPDTMNLS